MTTLTEGWPIIELLIAATSFEIAVAYASETHNYIEINNGKLASNQHEAHMNVRLRYPSQSRVREQR